MPLNFLAGVGGMSEFSMMTQGIPWPVSYSIFTVGMMLVGWITFICLQFFGKPNKHGRTSSQSNRK
jgi:magnesium transporter